MSRQTKVLLYDEVEATNATKIPFELTAQDFQGSSLPVLKARGLDTGDSISVWEWINGDWQDTGQTLDDGTAAATSLAMRSIGLYATTLVRAAGTISCELHSTAMRQV